jgi:hypothetical protein
VLQLGLKIKQKRSPMAGIDFIDENGDGPGVCLRKGKTKQADKNPMGYVARVCFGELPTGGPELPKPF